MAGGGVSRPAKAPRCVNIQFAGIVTCFIIFRDRVGHFVAAIALCSRAMLSGVPRGPRARKISATDNEEVLPAFHSQGVRMEALRTHEMSVRLAFASWPAPP